MENENEVVTLNDTEETVNDEIVLEDEAVDETEESSEDKDKIIATLKAQKEHWKDKANKKSEAKTEAKVETKAEVKASEALSQTDLYAMIKNDVDEVDIPVIQDYAALKGITVSEALKSDLVKTLLRDNAEKRNTANASNTGSSRKSNAKVSDEVLQSNAKKGELPESDEDMERLINSRFQK